MLLDFFKSLYSKLQHALGLLAKDLQSPLNDGQIWSSEDKQRLLVLYAEGLSDLDIAIQLGRSRNSVYQMRLKLQRKGLK